MIMKSTFYFLILLTAFGCKKTAVDTQFTGAPATEEMTSSALIDYSTATRAFGAVLPGKLDSRGNLVTAPKGIVFNLGSVTPTVFFKAIADRRASTARPGQFYCLGTTDRSYTNTIKVLNKFGSLGRSTNATSGRTIATTTLGNWFASTGGVYIPRQTSYSSGTTFPAVAAALGYKDANGATFKVYPTFVYFNTSVVSTTPTSSLVAIGEAFASDSDFKAINGNSSGRGRRWYGTCLPGADYPSGAYNVLSEIPGTSRSLMGSTGTSYVSYFYDDLICYCGY